ncbi:MAG: type II secretion system protein GspK [Candidatus Auribacterota bacterium]|nr:type II secretion system protein GspK [Candidatus Auribacterota bacterium]
MYCPTSPTGLTAASRAQITEPPGKRKLKVRDKNRAESGVVLLTVVLMIVLLAVLVMQFIYLSSLDKRMAAGARDSLEAYSLARAGVNRAIFLLEQDMLDGMDTGESGDTGAGAGQVKSVGDEEEDQGTDSLEEDWAQPGSAEELGSGEFSFKIVDEDRKFNLNLLLEDAVKKIASARAELSGGEAVAVEKEEVKEEDRDDPLKKIEREKKRKEEEKKKKEEESEEKSKEEEEDDDEIEVDDESPEYFSLTRLLEMIRSLADEADGIDPFAVSLFNTPRGTLDAIVEWMEDKPGGSAEGIERSGPLESIGELALTKDMTETMLVGWPHREEIEVEAKGDELELIDPWADKPFLGLRGYLTVYGDGMVNINTASREVLEVMLQDENDDQAALASDIIDAREELPFESIEDINDDEYLSDKIKDKFLERFKVSSEYFNILSEGKVGNTTARVRAVVQRQENRIVICYWRFEGR